VGQKLDRNKGTRKRYNKVRLGRKEETMEVLGKKQGHKKKNEMNRVWKQMKKEIGIKGKGRAVPVFFLPEYHTTKAYWGSAFFNLGTGWR
jgi:hypothetical protein